MNKLTLDVAISPVFKKAFQSLLDKEVPLQTAINLINISNAVNEEYAKFEKAQEKILEKASDEENQDKIEAKIKKLLGTTIDVPGVTLNELNGIKISANDLSVLAQCIISQPKQN
jgi:hypothetical protein